jgi:hypothetical protein
MLIPQASRSSRAREGYRPHPTNDSDLILRSLRSKRLEGWTQRRDSQPSFQTPSKRAQGRAPPATTAKPWRSDNGEAVAQG